MGVTLVTVLTADDGADDGGCDSRAQLLMWLMKADSNNTKQSSEEPKLLLEVTPGR